MEDSKGNYYWDLGSERVKLPGCLLNVWTLRVGTYSRLSAYYIFTMSPFTGSLFFLQRKSKQLNVKNCTIDSECRDCKPVRK